MDSPTKKTKNENEEKFDLSDTLISSERKKINGWDFCITSTKNKVTMKVDSISVTIMSTPSTTSDGYPVLLDGVPEIELMFSGCVVILRDEDGKFRKCEPSISPIHHYHPNSFGPQRGVIIGQMIAELSKEIGRINDETNEKELGYTFAKTGRRFW